MLELIGKKIGMSHMFSEEGLMIPVTFIEIYQNEILDINRNLEENFDKVTIAFDKISNAKKINKSQIGFFNKKATSLFRRVKECKIKKGSSFNLKDSFLLDSVLKEGDIVSVSGITIGKGFAGVMKRHNFRGLEASHGVSISHRSHGSTGQRQDPGKVFKGKKMAGHMGVDKVTVKNLKVLIIDPSKSVLGIKGAIPGNPGNDIIVKIAKI